MSVLARSLGSAGRPVLGRPVAAVVAALIATFAVGAPAALAGETTTPGPGDTAVDVSQTPATHPAVPLPADPPPADWPSGALPQTDPPSVDPLPAQPSPADPSPADPPATDPSPADPAGQDGSPADSPAADSPAADSSPADSSPADSPPAQLPSAQPPPTGPSEGEAPADHPPVESAPPSEGSHSAAHNQSRVIQAVWQVQQGCRTHCHGTSQMQRSEQVSDTTQRAIAISGEEGGGSSAQARNESSTIQFVWQMQIGCVAFCFHTSQSQEAFQQSYTTQEADAQSALTAWAENLAETVQHVFQIQQGCEHECHGVTQHQSSTQGQTTNQSATANAPGDDVGLFLVPDWLLAYAQNIGATIQLIYQYQEALCLEHCTGDAQLQEAIQRAVTDQNAVALAAPPEPAEAPPGGDPPPAPTGSSLAPEAGPPAAPSRAESSSVRQGFVRGWKRRRTVPRQELVLRTRGPSAGGGQAAPGGPAAAVLPEGAGGPAPGGSGLVPAVAHGSSGTTAAARATSDDDRRHVRAAGDRLPAQTFTMPSAQGAGGSMGWLLVLLLTAAGAALIASLRRVLATTMTRI